MKTNLPFEAVFLIRQWEPTRFKTSHDSYEYLASLFGYNSWHAFARDYLYSSKYELENKLEMLLGPHGYCYYRALLARRDG